jgi:hypothetical protein
MHKHDGSTTQTNPNFGTVDVLQQMLECYNRVSDHWRCPAYCKAISALCEAKEKVVNGPGAANYRDWGMIISNPQYNVYHLKFQEIDKRTYFSLISLYIITALKIIRWFISFALNSFHLRD